MSKQEENSMNNESELTTQEYQPGFLSELWQQARLLYQLFLDPEVPIYIKILPIAAAAYLIFPFDFLPDVLPGFGQLDDLTILVVGAKMFIELAPQHVVERYLQEMRTGYHDISPGDGDPVGGGVADQDVIDGIILDDESSE